MEDFILLLGSGRGEFVERGEYLVRSGLQFGQTVAIFCLVIDREGDEGVIDEIDDAGFVSTGRFVGRDDARGDGVDFDRLFGRKESEFGGGGGLRGIASVFGGGEKSGPIRGEPNCADASASAQQKIATTEIVGHR